MAAYSPVSPPATLGEAIRPLIGFSVADFGTLLTAVSGPRSFSLSKDELETLRNQLSIASTSLTYLLGALSFLYAHVARTVDSGVAFSDAIRALTDELDEQTSWEEKKDEVRDRLTAILQNKENHQRFRKIQRLQSGFIPNAVGFATFVDLRPDFGEGEELGLKGYLPVIQFRVTTDSSSPEGKRLVFQLNEDALVELKKVIDRAEAKLKTLKEQPAIALQLIKI